MAQSDTPYIEHQADTFSKEHIITDPHTITSLKEHLKQLVSINLNRWTQESMMKVVGKLQTDNRQENCVDAASKRKRKDLVDSELERRNNKNNTNLYLTKMNEYYIDECNALTLYAKKLYSEQ